MEVVTLMLDFGYAGLPTHEAEGESVFNILQNFEKRRPGIIQGTPKIRIHQESETGLVFVDLKVHDKEQAAKYKDEIRAELKAKGHQKLLDERNRKYQEEKSSEKSSTSPSKPTVKEAEGNCFIATATYGTYEHPNVLIFRGFRDRVLLNSSLGRIFVNNYYKISPSLAPVVKDSRILKQIARMVLDWIATIIK